MRPSSPRAGIAALCVILLAAAPAFAAEGAATPRAAVAAYVAAADAGDWDTASRYLDLRRVPSAERRAGGIDLARKLRVVLDRAVAVEVETVSDHPDGDRADGLPPNQERIAVVDTTGGPIAIDLHRGPQGWQFAPATVANVPALYAQIGDARIERLLPAPLVRIHLLGLALWQWIALLVLVAIAWVTSWLAPLVVRLATRSLIRHGAAETTTQMLGANVGPLRLGLAVLVFAAGVALVPLPPGARNTLGNLVRAATIVVIAWLLLRAIDVLVRVGTAALLTRGRVTATAVLPIGSRVLKLTVLAFMLIAMLQNAGINVTGLLAGLGLGGLVVALAAQKTMENLFGGVSLIIDQPLRVGDFCRFGDRVGTVEEIGLRSTRIRTLDRTVVSIPNSQFAAFELENFAPRDRIWLSTTLGLRYETTPDQLRHVLIEIRRMLYAHPKIQPDGARIRFVGFGTSSLDLEIFAYVLTADFGEFLAIREDIFLRIMDLVAASGTGFAFPSQTLYVAADGGLDQAKQAAAEAAVRAGRAEGRLPLPEFPRDMIDALRGTLRYPDGGAAAPPSPPKA